MKQLSVGDKAPAIASMDVMGKSVTVPSKNKYTIVTFLRYSGCPWCNLALHRLTLEYTLLQKHDCDVVALVQSSPQNIETNIYGRQSRRPQFPIIADEEADWYKIYGVKASMQILPYVAKGIPAWLQAVHTHKFKQAEMDGNLFLVPALFIIDDRSIIQFVDYEANFYTHETFTPIYELLTFGAN